MKGERAAIIARQNDAFRRGLGLTAGIPGRAFLTRSIAALPVEERVLQVWKLSEAQWRLRGEFPDTSGRPRSTARVHRR